MKAARNWNALLFKVEAWDSNCQQHIPRKFDGADVAAAIARLQERIATLQAENSQLKVERSAS